MTTPRKIATLAEGHITDVMADAEAYAEGAEALSGAPQLLTTTFPAIPDTSASGGGASNPDPATGERASGASVDYEDAQLQSIQFNGAVGFAIGDPEHASLPQVPTLTPPTASTASAAVAGLPSPVTLTAIQPVAPGAVALTSPGELSAGVAPLASAETLPTITPTTSGTFVAAPSSPVVLEAIQPVAPGAVALTGPGELSAGVAEFPPSITLNTLQVDQIQTPTLADTPPVTLQPASPVLPTASTSAPPTSLC